MVKNKKLEDYVIYSSALDEFLRLRNFSSEELETAIDKVGALISGNKRTIRDYVQFLVDFTVYDYAKHVKGPKDDAGYDALFEAVLEAYPMFQVDSVCEMMEEVKIYAKQSKLQIVVVTHRPQLADICDQVTILQ